MSYNKNEERKTSFFVVLVVVILLGISFFLSRGMHRGKNSESDSSVKQDITLKKDDSVLKEDKEPNGDSANSGVSNNMSADITESSSYLDVIDADCGNKCSGFSEPDDLIYCKEYCGIEEAKLTTENCADLEDLNQDYCYKHQARAKKDISLCQAIVDENIKQACNKQKF